MQSFMLENLLFNKYTAKLTNRLCFCNVDCEKGIF